MKNMWFYSLHSTCAVVGSLPPFPRPPAPGFGCCVHCLCALFYRRNVDGNDFLLHSHTRNAFEHFDRQRRKKCIRSEWILFNPSTWGDLPWQICTFRLTIALASAVPMYQRRSVRSLYFTCDGCNAEILQDYKHAAKENRIVSYNSE